MEVASKTFPDDIYWLNEQELGNWGIDTSSLRIDPWKIEPYSDGLVLTTTQYSGAEDSAVITFFCRRPDNGWRLLVSEESAGIARQTDLSGMGLSQHIKIGDGEFFIEPGDIEFIRSSGDRVFLSVLLPIDLASFAGQAMAFGGAQVTAYGFFLSFSVELPTAQLLNVTAKNCLN
jgi:hypothetical protein